MKKITHDGIVESVSGDMLNVKILQTSACAACKVSKHCHASDSKEKIINISQTNASLKYRQGDKITISMPESNGKEAVVWAFILPLFIIVGVIWIMVRVYHDEGIAALVGIGVLALYYFILYLFRDRLFKKFVFTVEND